MSNLDKLKVIENKVRNLIKERNLYKKRMNVSIDENRLCSNCNFKAQFIMDDKNKIAYPIKRLIDAKTYSGCTNKNKWGIDILALRGCNRGEK